MAGPDVGDEIGPSARTRRTSAPDVGRPAPCVVNEVVGIVEDNPLGNKPASGRIERKSLRQSVRALLFPMVAIALGLLCALGIAEIALRALSLAPSQAISTVTEAEFRRVPGVFGPEQRIVDRQLPALPFAVQIDSLGYRGAGFPRRKRPGELRIVAVGDSFTYGDFVDDDSTLPSVLQRELTKSCSRPITVINAGVGGSTITTAMHMVDRAWELEPDVVLLTFVENDVDDLRNDMWNELAANRRAKSRFPLSIVYPVIRRSALWNAALRLRGRVRVQGFSPASSLPVDPRARSDVDSLRDMYSRVLKSLANEVRTRGRSMVLVAFPSHLTVSGMTTDEQVRWVERAAKESEVPALNLLGPLMQSGLSTNALYLLPHDGHPSPRGYEIAGSWIADQLVSRGLCRAPE